MDPKLTSVVTGAAVWLAGVVASWAASHGLISADDKVQVVNSLVTLGGLGAAAAVMWWNRRQHSPTALIKAVNEAPNGVKVVSESSPAARVNKPVIGPGST